MKNYVKDYFDLEDKLKLAASFHDKEISGHLEPNCRQNSCITYAVRCDLTTCPLRSSLKSLDERVDRITEMIYDWRSSFVHEARIEAYLPNAQEAWVFGVHDRRPVSIGLYINELEKMFEKSVRRYLEAKIK